MEHVSEWKKGSPGDCRRRQLCVIACAGPGILQECSRGRAGPRTDACHPGRLPYQRCRGRRRLRRGGGQGRPRCGGSDPGAAQQHDPFRRSAEDRRDRGARADAGRPGQVPWADRYGVGTACRRCRRHPARQRRRRSGVLPAGRLRAGYRMVCGAGAGGGLRAGQLHSLLHRVARCLAPPVRGKAAADHRRRYQKPSRGDHRPPRADQPVPRARRPAGPDLSAQFRRQLRFREHAGA